MKPKKVLQFILPLLAFLIFWEGISRSGIVSIKLFPGPSIVFFAMVELFSKGFLLDIYSSLSRVMVGILLGSLAGVVIGISTARIKFFDISLTPLIQIFRAFPPVALIPLIIVWFGIGEIAKIVSIAFAVFFPVWVNTHLGAKRVQTHYLRAANTLTKSKAKIFSKVVFPATIPFAFAGIRIGIGIAFIMVYVSELAGASTGIGYQIAVMHLNYSIDKMIAALLFLGLIAAATDAIFSMLTHKVLPWLQKT